MAVQKVWSYAGTASGADADGRKCIFCGKTIVDESQPGHWEIKAEEDDPDVDYVIEHGYSHYECTQAELARRNRPRFQLPEVPDLPRR